MFFYSAGPAIHRSSLHGVPLHFERVPSLRWRVSVFDFLIFFQKTFRRNARWACKCMCEHSCCTLCTYLPPPPPLSVVHQRARKRETYERLAIKILHTVGWTCQELHVRMCIAHVSGLIEFPAAPVLSLSGLLEVSTSQPITHPDRYSGSPCRSRCPTIHISLSFLLQLPGHRLWWPCTVTNGYYILGVYHSCSNPNHQPQAYRPTTT